MRVPVLNRLLAADGAFDGGRLRLDPDFGGVGSPVIFTGGASKEKPFWAFAHLDTISYLVQPEQGGRTFRSSRTACISCMTANAPLTLTAMILNRTAIAWSPRAGSNRPAGRPSFDPMTPRRSSFGPAIGSRRSLPSAKLGQGGLFTGLMDNAGGVAALAVAAPVLAEAGVEAMLAFPDEEEGPVGSGQPDDVPGQRPHRRPSAAAEARDRRGRPAGRRRPGRRHAGRRRELDTARRAAQSSRSSPASRAAPSRLSASMDWRAAWPM